jgi:hypothetical protein
MAIGDDGRPRCTWCDKVAFGVVEGPDGKELPICPDHYIGLQGVENERQRNLSDHARHTMAMMNHAIDEMNMVTGLDLGGKVVIPAPTPVSNFSNVTVSNSTIGVVNTAAVGQISAYVHHMPQGDAARQAVEQITAAVVSAAISDADRKNLLDQIGLVAEQAVAAPQKRKAAVVGPILTAIAQGAATVTALAETWRTVEPILKAHFGLP